MTTLTEWSTLPSLSDSLTVMTAAVQAPLSALSDKFDSLALGGSRDARDTRAGNVTQAERILRKALVSEEEKNVSEW